MRFKKITPLLFVSFSLLFLSNLFSQNKAPKSEKETLLESLHSISSQKLYNYVAELSSEKYAGRLTGTAEYQAAAEWIASFQKWGIKSCGDKNSYFQKFKNNRIRKVFIMISDLSPKGKKPLFVRLWMLHNFFIMMNVYHHSKIIFQGFLHCPIHARKKLSVNRVRWRR